MPRNLILLMVLFLVWPARAFSAPGVTIKVVDDQTGRGVPLVRLTTTDSIDFWTDSSGIVYVDDAALLGHSVYFSIFSHGYEFPADGFKYRGKAIDLTPGRTVELKIHRTNIAERLYRLTGEGIYRDTMAAGLKPSIEQPLLNAGVVGQDTCQCVVYDGKIRWFFGDTSKFDYPLGMFGTSGATSDLSGLSPSDGVNLHYFEDDKKFSRRMLPKFEKGAGWLDSLCVVPDAAGKPRMVAKCDNVPGVAKAFGKYLLVYKDKTDAFEITSKIPEDAPLTPGGERVYRRGRRQAVRLFLSAVSERPSAGDGGGVWGFERSTKFFTALFPHRRRGSGRFRKRMRRLVIS